MWLSLLLLLLLVCSIHATHFMGTVMTYYPKNTDAAGSMTVVLRYKLNFHFCIQTDSWTCSGGDCGPESPGQTNTVDQGSSFEWCQTEGIMTQQVSSNAPFQLQLDGFNWLNNLNGVWSWKAVTLVEVRSRSDTGQANRSPQTTIVPLVRVPLNCQIDLHLLAFDPDGDEVRCRYGDTALSECDPCTPPPVLSLSSLCTLSFSATSSTAVGAYVVQLVVEDFPRKTVTLTQSDGEQTTITTNTALSKLPVQFALRVDPVVPSCTEGLYLPMFLPPTPANGAQFYTPVSQTLEISISAQANISTISELLFSGPYNTDRTPSGAGHYTLRWTPSESEDGESHPFCFIIQALFNLVKYHSELRCVIVSVGNEPPRTTMNPTTTPTTIHSTTTPLITTTTTLTTSTTTTPLTTTTITTAPTTTTQVTTTITSTTQKNTTPLQTSTTTTPVTTTTTSSQTTPSVTSPPSPTPVTEVLNPIVVGLRIKISSSLSEDYIRNTVIQQIRDELVKRGLPPDITLRIVSSVQLESTTTAPPAVPP